MLRTLCPRFYGTVEDNNTVGGGYLRLEDLTRPFHNPCIIDIKMGKVTWDPDATDTKRKREESKYPPLKKTGFQLLGCRVSWNMGIYIFTYVYVCMCMYIYVYMSLFFNVNSKLR